MAVEGPGKLQVEPRVCRLAASPDSTVQQQAENLLREGRFREKRMIESAEALEREW